MSQHCASHSRCLAHSSRSRTCRPFRPTACAPPAAPAALQTATFQQPDAIEMGEYDYNRSGNPTRTVLEKMLAQMEVGRVGAGLADGAG